MKECPKCKEVKTLDSFANNKSKKDGLQRTCRKCVAIKDKKWFQDNREKYYANGRKYYYERTEFINRYKKIFGMCVDCKITDWRVLEFDHVKGEKKGNIGDMKSSSFKIIKEEIRKCEVRCANCHRIKTFHK
tara:strand:+ start:113 stop:508 length:396 start_codon:yes stop_codon:yes gene_type:complete